MPSAPAPLRASTDVATIAANTSAKPGTRHGFGRIREQVTRTIAVAITHTTAATHTISIP